MALTSPLQIYNTLRRKIVPFHSLRSEEVAMYTCGPTVYAPAHIGNLRTFVVSDWLRRVLEWNNYQVTAVMNVTDVDDKTIKGSRAAGVPLPSFTKPFEETFFADLDSLNIERPTHTPLATEYIKPIIEMIDILLQRDLAYQAVDGIYFRVAKAKDYGALAQLKFNPTATQSRIGSDQYDKEAASDFALWKFWQAADGEVGWEAPFGRGRPGWHIECSAMIRTLLGDTIDFHLGGTDLIFPHHTNEMAQSEAVTGRPLANHWLHIAFVNMANSKMAKSKGNIITLAEIIVRGVPSLAYRYWLLSAHYRTVMNFSWEALAGAANSLRRLRHYVFDLSEKNKSGGKTGIINQEYLSKFTEAINDDLNLPVALSIVWQLLGDYSPASPDMLTTILEFDKVLGFDLASATEPEVFSEIPNEVKQLVIDRESAREVNDFSRADSLRQEITTAGYAIEDTPEGPRLRKK